MHTGKNIVDLFNPNGDPIAVLSLADPDWADTLSKRLKVKEPPLSKDAVRRIVTGILDALSVEMSFGQAVMTGITDLVGRIDDNLLMQYCRLTRWAGGRGPTLGRILSLHLVPVFRYAEGKYLDRMLAAVDIMRQKGTYTLKDPLDTLSLLLNSRDEPSVAQYLGLLSDTYSREMSYNRCQHYTREIPRAVREMRPSKRAFQISQMRRLVGTDLSLLLPFLGGLGKGLELLSRQALASFVAQALTEFDRNRESGFKFLSLKSLAGLDASENLQVSVPIERVRGQLNRYLYARLDLPLSVCSMKSLPLAFQNSQEENQPLVCVDSRRLYLPDEIDRFLTRKENRRLYRILTKLEAACIEFGTYRFDPEKASASCPYIHKGGAPATRLPIRNTKEEFHRAQGTGSGLECFFNFFPNGDLAATLFTIYEHGRLRILMEQHYPGLVKEAMPLLKKEVDLQAAEGGGRQMLIQMYRRIALGADGSFTGTPPGEDLDLLKRIAIRFDREMTPRSGVTATARLTVKTYSDIAARVIGEKAAQPYSGSTQYLRTPFGRWIRPEIVAASYRHYEKVALRIKERFAGADVILYQADILWEMIKSQGELSEESVKTLMDRSLKRDDTQAGRRVGGKGQVPDIDIAGILELGNSATGLCGDQSGDAFRYREWDHLLGDYLPDHVRVSDRPLKGEGNGFYREALKKHRGLIRKIRYGFELLKPEAYTLYRRWIEGDEFDYRALLDFAIDRKMGRTPSERLYNKRVKNHRDVAVLLLVDVSRSTANRVPGSAATVLDVEKEAVVLFCEALSAVGDAFAVAGFSGTGRLGVDYFRVKEFHETMDEGAKERLGALTPQRNTRMGAAFRHAAAQLAQIPSRVRLLLILGDGFPNDTEYKKAYAAEDTRKAVLEARSADLFTHAITVNLADANLDHLYGRARHSVISDVRELPDKLPRIYGALTRT